MLMFNIFYVKYILLILFDYFHRVISVKGNNFGAHCNNKVHHFKYA